jgi:hypothetical protein
VHEIVTRPSFRYCAEILTFPGLVGTIVKVSTGVLFSGKVVFAMKRILQLLLAKVKWSDEKLF